MWRCCRVEWGGMDDVQFSDNQCLLRQCISCQWCSYFILAVVWTPPRNRKCMQSFLFPCDIISTGRPCTHMRSASHKINSVICVFVSLIPVINLTMIHGEVCKKRRRANDFETQSINHFIKRKKPERPINSVKSKQKVYLTTLVILVWGAHLKMIKRLLVISLRFLSHRCWRSISDMNIILY